MFPSGSTGIASANPSPSRGPATVRSAARKAIPADQCAGKNGKVAVVQATKAAAGAAGRKGTTRLNSGTDTVRGRRKARRDIFFGRSRRYRALRKLFASCAAGGRFEGSTDN